MHAGTGHWTTARVCEAEHLLAADNSTFDRERFLTACGYLVPANVKV